MRAFIAIDLPENLRAALGRKQAVLGAVCPDARWSRQDAIHLTLKFLGEISDERAKQVTDALDGLEPFKKFSIEVKNFGFFPNARRPQVFWAGLEAPSALEQLVARVEAAMKNLGFAREQRTFTPHLTLARFKTPRPQPALEALLERQRELTPDRFEVSEFFLFESKLSPRGAEYRKVARFPGL